MGLQETILCDRCQARIFPGDAVRAEIRMQSGTVDAENFHPVGDVQGQKMLLHRWCAAVIVRSTKTERLARKDPKMPCARHRRTREELAEAGVLGKTTKKRKKSDKSNKTKAKSKAKGKRRKG